MAIDMDHLMQVLVSDYPPPIAFVPPLILLLLGILSIIDAFTGRVPDVLSIGGFGAAFFALAYYAGWIEAAEHLGYAIAAVVALRFLNYLYLKVSRHDAFGFGDAKWTALAVIGYGLAPVAWAWVIGAWLGIVWMGLRKLWRKVTKTYEGHEYVHFAPFLFIGLLVSLVVIS